MKKIVLGYDESDAAKRALERAAQLTKAFGSELIVTSVAPVMTQHRTLGWARSTRPTLRRTTVEELKHAKTYLEGQGMQADYLTGLGRPGRDDRRARQGAAMPI